jgi:hypothetical protein
VCLAPTMAPPNKIVLRYGLVRLFERPAFHVGSLKRVVTFAVREAHGDPNERDELSITDWLELADSISWPGGTSCAGSCVAGRH